MRDLFCRTCFCIYFFPTIYISISTCQYWYALLISTTYSQFILNDFGIILMILWRLLSSSSAGAESSPPDAAAAVVGAAVVVAGTAEATEAEADGGGLLPPPLAVPDGLVLFFSVITGRKIGSPMGVQRIWYRLSQKNWWSILQLRSYRRKVEVNWRRRWLRIELGELTVYFLSLM